MKLRTNLHFHTKEDPRHRHGITYNLYEGIDYAVSQGFNVLAVTCHRSYVATESHVEYARDRGLLLIPGIEADIYTEDGKNRNHVLILNGNKHSERLRTFSDLASYRNENPHVFVVAPHPYHVGPFSLHEQLEANIELFDAIEHSWFHSPRFDRNRRAREVAEQYGKPYVATSDTHFLDYLNDSYFEAEADELSADALFKALRTGDFVNVTRPLRGWSDLIVRSSLFVLRDDVQRALHAIHPRLCPVCERTGQHEHAELIRS